MRAIRLAVTLVSWLGHKPMEHTPVFWTARKCASCNRLESARPRRLNPPGHPEAIQALCYCGHVSDPRAYWVDALRSFYGDVPGRSPMFGPKVGDRFRVKTCEPPVYPLGLLQVGDSVELLDFLIGSYTVRRLSDGLIAEIAGPNIGEPVEM